MRKIFNVLFLFTATITQAQNTIDWDGVYELQLTDFQASTTQIGDVNLYSLSGMATFDFSYHMTNGEFMFTKNFNSKVNCTFNRNAASLVAPDSSMATDLLNFARYEFDLAELYARKLRKSIYEEKGAFSDTNFFKPLYDAVMKDFSERHTEAAKETDLGRDEEKLHELHNEVRREIHGLSDFCKLCKPPKKKKN